jgi:hypothetical protein
MMSRNTRFVIHVLAVRLLLILVGSTIIVWIFSEAMFQLQKDEYDRPPKVIQLVIPAGTAEKVAAGDPVPAIPAEMVFVVGDTLTIKNEDSVIHQLGPMLIPAGTSASMQLGDANKVAYQCSFASTHYLGLDIRLPTTIMSRLVALGVAGPTLGFFFFAYSIVLWPVKTGEKSVPQPAGLDVDQSPAYSGDESRS